MLKIHQLTKVFPSQETPVLNNLNLKLEQGEFCILLGSNGSGKSTLLKLLAGDYLCDNGGISLGGTDITYQPVYRRAPFISYVTQDITQGTIPQMTLLENLVLGSLRTEKTKFKLYRRNNQHIQDAIKSLGLGLEKHFHTPLSALSGGQRQTVAIVMALLSAPKLLLLDEHTSALDPQAQQKIMDYTAHHIQAQNLTSLMITHKIEDALKYGSRLIMLHQGRITLDVKGAKKMALTAKHLHTLFQVQGDL